MDFVRPQLQVEKTQVTVRSAEYGITFDREDIRKIELLDALPEEEFRRTHGLSDNRQLHGKFQGEETGKAMFYVHRGETPILKIELAEYTVFITGEDEKTVQMWYEELSS